MGMAHILVLPFPAQGHVNPLMHLSKIISNHGIEVTFLNTEYNHRRVLNAMTGSVDSTTSTSTCSSVSFVSVPDGLEDDDERDNFGKLCDSILAAIPPRVEEVINSLKGDGGITCILADADMAWVRKIAVKLGVEVAIFWPLSAAIFFIDSKINSMIHDGLIDSNGYSTGNHVTEFSPSMPSIDIANLPWSMIDPQSRESIFNYIRIITEETQLAEWKLANSTPALEPGAFSLSANLLPIGPLIANYDTGSSGAQFWQEDSTYLKWLDQQQPNSVIYVSFGSVANLEQTQFEELALGLELTGKPFLWVVRHGIADEMHQNVKSRNGKIVGWVSQQKVLEHPAIACFVSHCGWNSTIEGANYGVPFLCWPYFADQFLNRDYICDIWKVGLGLNNDEDGLVRKEEVKEKLEKLIGDKTIKAGSMKLRDLVREYWREWSILKKSQQFHQLAQEIASLQMLVLIRI